MMKVINMFNKFVERERKKKLDRHFMKKQK